MFFYSSISQYLRWDRGSFVLSQNISSVASELKNVLLAQSGTYIWIGSGVSKQAQYLDWKQTVQELCEKCGVPPIESGETATSCVLLGKAHECKNVNLDKYEETLIDLFSKDPACIPEEITLLLHLPIAGFLTTNFDPLLAKAVSRHFGGNPIKYSINDYPNYVSKDIGDWREIGVRLPLFYMHGYIFPADTSPHPSAKNLVFTSRDFSEPTYSFIVDSFLNELLKLNSIIFIGYSLSEDPIQKIFQKMSEIFKTLQTRHPNWELPPKYIILRTKRTVLEGSPSKRDYAQEEEENKIFLELGVRTIRVEDFADISRILKQVQNLLDTVSPVGKLDPFVKR